jgi:hypothetical protein
MATVSVTGDHRAMDHLPDWTVTIIAVAVGLSPGLALLIARPIGRFLRRALVERPEVAPQSRGPASDELVKARRSLLSPTASANAR